MGDIGRGFRTIFFFLELMFFLTLASGIISEQKKPVVTAIDVDMSENISEQCLFEVQENKASIYVIEETDSVRNPWQVNKREVKLQKSEETGDYLAKSNDLGMETLVCYTSKTLEDGAVVRLQKRDALEKEGKIVFLNMETGEKKELPFCGIPEEEERRIRSEYGMDESWQSYIFTEEGCEAAPHNLGRLFWLLSAFFLLLCLLAKDIISFGRNMQKKLKECYVREMLAQNISTVLLHLIWWVCGIFGLCFLLIGMRNLDYSFLAQWLPEERTIDFAHYRAIYMEWKRKTFRYIYFYPDDAYAVLLRESVKTWKMCVVNAAAAFGFYVAGRWGMGLVRMYKKWSVRGREE